MRRDLLWLFLTLVSSNVAYGEAYNSPKGISIPVIRNIQSIASPLTPSNWIVDPEFIPYINQFKRDYYKYLGKTLTFGALKMSWSLQAGTGYAGTCNRKGENWWIEIMRLDGGWGYYTDCQREELIYHELGHCVLNEPHAETGIMHSGIRDPEVCEKTREASKKLLFENARQRIKKVSVPEGAWYPDETTETEE